MNANWPEGFAYRMLVDNTPDYVYALDLEGRFVAVNQRCCDFLGLGRDEVIGRSLDGVGLTADVAQASQALLRRVLQSGMPVKSTLEVRTEAGRGELQEVSLAPIVDQGRMIGVHGHNCDVTMHMDISAERDRLQRRLEALWRTAELVDVDYRTLCDHVVNEIAEMTGSASAFWAYLNLEGTQLYFHGLPREAEQLCQLQMPPDATLDIESGGLWTEPIKQRKPVIVNDYASTQYRSKKGLPEGHMPLERVLLIPVMRQGQIIAVAGMGNKESDYTQQDVRDAEAFLNSIQAILDRRKYEEDLERSHAEIRERNHQQELLNAVTACFNAANHVEQVLDATLDAFQQMGYRYCSLWAMGEERLVAYPRPRCGFGELLSRLMPGLEPSEMADRGLWTSLGDEPLFARVVQEGRTQRGSLAAFSLALRVGDEVLAEKDPLFHERISQLAQDLEIAECVAFPLGDYVIVACNPKVDDSRESRYDWGYTLAQQAGVAVARQRAIDALRQSEGRFRDLVESVSDMVWEIDEQNRYTYISPQIEHVLGYKPAELLGKTPFDVMIAAEARRVSAIFESYAERGEGSAHVENTVTHKDGHQVVLETSFQPIRGSDGAMKGWRGIDRDITARVQAQRMALQMSRIEATTTLAGGIAHDFNNLMVGVLGYAELLRAELPHVLDSAIGESERQRINNDVSEMLAVIADSAQQAGHLAQQMLAFAQGGDHEPRDVELNKAIREVVRLQERHIVKDVHLDLELEEGLWLVHADPTQINHVVLNLLTNALEAIEGKGHIRITSRNIDLDVASAAAIPALQAGRYAEIAIQDDGPGMSQDMQAKIFSPFFSTKAFGRGLGLAAVYGIVQNHAGHIAVTSEVGRGTTFKILLPAREGIPQAAKAPQEPACADTEGALTILVVDDEAAVLTVTRRMLERLGYRVLVARQAWEAIHIAQEHDGPIDVILLDLAMPGMSGAEAYPFLREARQCAKVFICSGYDVDAETRGLLEAGVYGFIAKPFGFSKLDEELRGALAG